MDFLLKIFFIWQREGFISLFHRVLDKSIESLKLRMKFLKAQLEYNKLPKIRKVKPVTSLSNKPMILIIDLHVPMYDRESGSFRLFNIIKILLDLGYSITFLPEDGYAKEPYTSNLQELGVEVLYRTPEKPNLRGQLRERMPFIDIAWVCRPKLCKKYLELLKENPKIKIIYDTVDIHFIRLKRQWELFFHKNIFLAKVWKNTQNLEIKLAQLSDITIVITEVEKSIFNEMGIKNIWTIPNIHKPYSGTLKNFNQRDGLLFIGYYGHPPNVDAVIWLYEEIMPLVWQSNPEIKLILLGDSPSPRIKALAGQHVIVPGYVKDVEPYFTTSRVFVAPLRFGAGMKGKIGQSLSYGLPTVTTSIGAEGMELTHGIDAMIVDEAEGFAQCILSLYNNPNLWNCVSKNAINKVQQYTPEAVQFQLSGMLEFLSKINK